MLRLRTIMLLILLSAFAAGLLTGCDNADIRASVKGSAARLWPYSDTGEVEININNEWFSDSFEGSCEWSVYAQDRGAKQIFEFLYFADKSGGVKTEKYVLSEGGVTMAYFETNTTAEANVKTTYYINEMSKKAYRDLTAEEANEADDYPGVDFGIMRDGVRQMKRFGAVSLQGDGSDWTFVSKKAGVQITGPDNESVSVTEYEYRDIREESSVTMYIDFEESCLPSLYRTKYIVADAESELIIEVYIKQHTGSVTQAEVAAPSAAYGYLIYS